MRAVLVPAAFALAASAVFFVPRSSHAEGGEPAEARAQIEATLAQMRATSLRVRDDLRATRKRGTKLQITCVDEALSRSDVALRRARELGDAIVAAYARDDLDAARAARRRLSELREAQRQAATTAASCAPRVVPVAVPDTTTVKLRVDPNIAPAP